ncbi:MAG: hypothetical protein NT121_02195, partial [Chloroflexi bacterium]|nr:hypothetical protein [Chloroflexota bacterium]
MKHQPWIFTVLLLMLSACSLPVADQPTPLPPTVEATISPPATESATAPTTAPISSTDIPVSQLPSGALMIVTLGDSLTQGDGDDAELGGSPQSLQK